MKSVTIQMINMYKMKEKKCDFMGYKIQRDESLTFHHLVVPRRHCHKKRIPNDGYIVSNGAILKRVSHDYLHLIERYDYDLFMAITSEMIDINHKGYIDDENLMAIEHLLEVFEEEYKDETGKKGRQLIKKEYKEGRIYGK